MAQLNDTPEWLKNVEAQDDVQPLKQPEVSDHGSSAAQGTGSLKLPKIPGIQAPNKVTLLHWGLKIVTMCLCVLMAFTAVLGLGKKLL